MDRKYFIKSCGLACLTGTGIIALLDGCGSMKMMTGNIVGSNLVVPLSDFEKVNGGKPNGYKKYIVIQNDALQYPVCVYRFSDNEYSALWMRCTHQGTELQVFGDKLQCPAHGSEFSNRGAVRNGPADQPLKTFPVQIINESLTISLKSA